MTEAEPKPSAYQQARDEIEGRKPNPPPAVADETTPPAGPHAAPELTNDAATPGAGTLPDGEQGDDAEAGTG